MAIVHESLDRARRTWRTVEVGIGVLRSVALLLAAVLIAVAADNLLALPGAVRLVLALAFVGALILLLLTQVLSPLLRPLSDEMVSRHVESAYPELDNRLINAVLLQQERIADPLTRRMVASQLNETARTVGAYDMETSTSARPLWRWARWAIAAVLVTVAYGVVFSRYFTNAVSRYASPTRYIAPITGTRLSVSPGDAEVLQGDSLLVEALVEGVLPEKAHLHSKGRQGGSARRPMPYEGNAFTCELANLQESFRYWVKAGDATSQTFSVRVRTRPTVTAVKLLYVYPSYTGMPSKATESQTGDIRALEGTTVRIEAIADRELEGAELAVRFMPAAEEADQPDGESVPMKLTRARTAEAEITVTRTGDYRINVTDRDGVANLPVARQIVALPDQAPFVKVLEPAKDLAVEPDASVPVLAEAKDDFALRSLALHVQRRGGAEWEELRSWPCAEATRQAREGAVLHLGDLALAPRDVLSYYFSAGDGRPGAPEGAGKSRVYQILVVDKSFAQQQEKQQQEALRSVIGRLIVMQKANLAATEKLGRWSEDGNPEIAGGAEAAERFRAEADSLVRTEEDIYAAATDAVREHAGMAQTETLEVLASIAAREVAQAVDQLGSLAGAADSAHVSVAATEAGGTERRIVELLQRLLDDPRALLAERLKEEGSREEVSEQFEELLDARARAEKMLEQIKDFQQEQGEAVELISQLAEVFVDDFTEGDERALGDFVNTERRWAEYFQETATDLSKLNPQDFGLARMAKDYMAIYSELAESVNAAQRKETREIATPESAGAMPLAEEIQENIEKWLSASADTDAWKMEDPLQDADLPLAPLPDELEDLFGDLLEEEEDMIDEIEDATSAWAMSMDKGIGWDAMDGPMSNMSAKGVTGNRLPNEQEIGGRSGEGRTGKSSGQHVGDTAVGKGGRRTPTRLTPDPFEAGAVNDTSPEPATGSTGGGKVSGAGEEGLQGPVPMALQDRLKRLADSQQQLIDKANRVDYGLRKYRYPRGRLPETIELMEELKSDLEGAEDILTAGTRHRVVLSNLRELKSLIAAQKQVIRDRTALLPKELRDEIAAARDEVVPAQYQDMVDEYFRALSQAGSVRQEAP